MAKRKHRKKAKSTDRHPSQYHVQRPKHHECLPSSTLPSSGDDAESQAAVTRGALFAALPPEIRDRIFSFLIVQPVKWDMLHQGCPLLTSDEDPKPLRPPGYLCADCDAPNIHLWRNHWSPAWVSSWRSEWAPDRPNPYVCSDCYDTWLRPAPYPLARSLPCLCARRRNLQILLVCRQWYAETARVLYSQNTFAFEDSSTFSNFINNLDPRWRGKVSRVSLMALVRDPAHDRESGLPANARLHGRVVNLQFDLDRTLWSCLRKLPNLSALEIDVLYLANPHTVKRMLGLGLQNLRTLRFIERTPPVAPSGKGSAYVWPGLVDRKLIVGGFVGEVGRAIRGEREPRLKSYRSICASVDEMRKRLNLDILGGAKM